MQRVDSAAITHHQHAGITPQDLVLVRDLRGMARKVVRKISLDEARTLNDCKELRDSVLQDIRPVRGWLELHLCLDVEEGKTAEEYRHRPHTAIYPNLQLESESAFTTEERSLQKIVCKRKGQKGERIVGIPLEDDDITAMGMGTHHTLKEHPFLFRHHQYIEVHLQCYRDLKDVGFRVMEDWVAENNLHKEIPYWRCDFFSPQQFMAVNNPFYVGKGVITNDNKVDVAVAIDEQRVYEKVKEKASLSDDSL